MDLKFEVSTNISFEVKTVELFTQKSFASLDDTPNVTLVSMHCLKLPFAIGPYHQETCQEMNY